MSGSPTFYPQPYPVPLGLQSDRCLLEPLTTDHVGLDYAALMESRTLLRRWSGSSWPSDDFTLTQNWQDLNRHQLEHQDRVAFTYTVLTPSRDRCLGCVYIKSMTALEALMHGTAAGEAMPDRLATTRFWISQPHLAEELDRHLLQLLIPWFDQAWEFQSHSFHAHVSDKRQQLLFAQAGLKQYRWLADPSRGRLSFWNPG